MFDRYSGVHVSGINVMLLTYCYLSSCIHVQCTWYRSSFTVPPFIVSVDDYRRSCSSNFFSVCMFSET